MSDKIISAHKLVEYAFASAQRRVTIIENALQPPTFIMDTKYPDIERATGHFLVSKCADASRLDNLDQTYQSREAHTDHHEQRLLNAMDAISHVKTMRWQLPEGSQVQFGQGLPIDMEVGGMKVRLRAPVALWRHQAGYRDPFVGLGKSYFGKSAPLRSGNVVERGVLFATFLHWFAETHLGHIGIPDPTMCFVADVFDERIHFAAKRFIQRRKHLEALAQEMADRWDPIISRLQTKPSTRSSSTMK